MRLALDPQMFYATSSVFELPDIVASLGYDWMELSPKADFIPFFRYPDTAGLGPESGFAPPVRRKRICARRAWNVS